jgi:D-inositol-3-phosphate glycosyltransferase
MVKTVAMMSVHTCPLAPLGEKETGGMNVFIRELSTELGRLGIRVDIFTRKTAPDEELPEIVHISPEVTIIHTTAGPQKKINKYHILNYIEDFVDSALAYGERTKTAYDLIHSNYWLSGAVSMILKQKWHVPMIHTYHTLGLLKNSAQNISEKQEKSERFVIEKKILSRADRILTSNPEEKTFLTETYYYDAGKIDLIPWGVNLRVFKPLARESAKKHIGFPHTKLILYAGRIDPVKGIEFLIRAFHKTVQKEPHAELLIIGGTRGQENAYLGRLKELTEAFSLTSQVHFPGKKQQKELPFYYSAAEACVFPSLYESFGMAALEAMACASPVIATHTGGLTTIVRDNETGFIVPVADVDALSERMNRILADTNLRKRLSHEAFLWAQQFDWHYIAQRIAALYEEVAPQRDS